jgi:hypothetical protein
MKKNKKKPKILRGPSKQKKRLLKPVVSQVFFIFKQHFTHKTLLLPFILMSNGK